MQTAAKKRAPSAAAFGRTVAHHRRISSLSNIQEQFFPPLRGKKIRGLRSRVFHGASSIAGNFTLATRANAPFPSFPQPRISAREIPRSLPVKEPLFSLRARERGRVRKKRRKRSDASLYPRPVCKQPDFRLTFPSVAFFRINRRGNQGKGRFSRLPSLNLDNSRLNNLSHMFLCKYVQLHQTHLFRIFSRLCVI